MASPRYSEREPEGGGGGAPIKLCGALIGLFVFKTSSTVAIMVPGPFQWGRRFTTD